MPSRTLFRTNAEATGVTGKTRPNRRLFACLLSSAIGAVLTVPAFAETMLSPAQSANMYNTNNAAIGWTQASAFDDITITADLANANGIQDSFSVTAYITTSLGPGTTQSDVVASDTLSLQFLGTDLATFSFPDLTLVAGSYYLLIAAPIGIDVYANKKTWVLGAGISNPSQSFGVNDDPSFEPGDTFSTGAIGLGNNEFFTVTMTGTPLATPTPEPMTLSLFGAGLAALAATRRRR